MQHDGKRLKAIFEAKRLNNTEVASIVGVSKVTVSSDVNTEVLSRSKVSKYAKALNFEVDEVYNSLNPVEMESGERPLYELIDVLYRINSDLRKRLAEKELELSF